MLKGTDVIAKHLCTDARANEFTTSLLLRVFTKRDFATEFSCIKISCVRKTAKFFFKPLFGSEVSNLCALSMVLEKAHFVTSSFSN